MFNAPVLSIARARASAKGPFFSSMSRVARTAASHISSTVVRWRLANFKLWAETYQTDVGRVAKTLRSRSPRNRLRPMSVPRCAKTTEPRFGHAETLFRSPRELNDC